MLPSTGTAEPQIGQPPFLPVVAGRGGIGGAQTLTMIVPSMALGEFVIAGAFRLLARGAFLGLLHGV